MQFMPVSQAEHGAVLGDQPPGAETTRREVAAVLFNPSDEDQRANVQWLVYSFPRRQATAQPRFVSIWSSVYEPLQYPLLFVRGEVGWFHEWWNHEMRPCHQPMTASSAKHCRSKDDLAVVPSAALDGG